MSRLLYVDVVLAPGLLPAYSREGATCVVIDIFRASTSIITALANGARRIIPIETLDEARLLRDEGKVVGAERNCQRCDFAQFGNDPFEFTPEQVAGKDIYFTTTNGTRTIKRCMEQGLEVVVGGFVNLSAVASYLRDESVLCVCAGWQGKFGIEDAIYAGALVDALRESHTIGSDAARLMCSEWKHHRSDLLKYLRESDHYARLRSHDKLNAVTYCLSQDIHTIVPKASVNGSEISLTL